VTKLIAALIIVAALYCGWALFSYWEKVKNGEEAQQKQDAAAIVTGDRLPGLPYHLESSLQTAQKLGAAGLRNWLKAYGQSLEDPRKAWIELDFCVAVAREDPAEARRVFAAVKERLGSASPVWPRMKTLEKTYE
jgi:hypothetical protein